MRDRTIAEVLRNRASRQGDATVYTFLSGSPAEPGRFTFGELDRRARVIAGHLTRSGLRGERALLLYPAGPEFVEAFFGCLYAGVVAVPAYPPRANKTLPRLESMAADCRAIAALVPAAILERSRETGLSRPALAKLRWIATDELDGRDGQGPCPAGEGDLAYLQYTSGSTSEPKGVMITHGNVLANSEEIRRGFGHTSESRSLSWLPHFHDMGLIDGIIQPVYSGFPAALMDPMSFLQAPSRWLQAISDLGITHSGGPNFAYDLCVRRVEPDPSKMDLRAWAVAYNGAEPVRPETLARFTERFACCGFRRESFYPAYGLAEATLKVTGGSRGEGPTSIRVNRSALEAGHADGIGADLELTGSGRAAGPTRVRIVSPGSGLELSEGEVGEIWVSGPGVAIGYWNRPEETEATFAARLHGETARHLRTGDLGFVVNGELFVTGRVKDMVIVRGRNIYPQDVERTAESCDPALRPSAGAAFGIDTGGEERLVLVHEVERHFAADPRHLIASIRSAIVEAHEVDPHAIVLVKPSGVPRTSSGKVRRRACREAFLGGSLPIVAEWRAPEPERAPRPAGAAGVRDWLEARVAAKLGVAPDAIAFDQPLARFGLDSLRATELAHEIEEAFGVELPAAELLAASSLAEIAERAESAPAAGRAGEADGGAPEECPLSAGQLALWFLHELAPSSAAYTIASALRLTGSLDERAFEGAARDLVARHASLRARFTGAAGSPRQRFDVPFERIYSAGDLRGVEPEALPAHLADEAGAPFDLEAGPLFRVRLLREETTWILLISAHHAVADLWSLSIVLRDLRALYAARIGAPHEPLPPAPHPAGFVRWQEGFVRSAAGQRQLARWRERLAGEPAPLELPADRPRPPSQSFRGGVRTFRIDPDLAASLRDLARSRGVTLYALMLAAYQAFLGRVSGRHDVLVGAPAAGRTSSRFAGLVAYLVNPIVLRAGLESDPSFEELLLSARDGLLSALEDQDYPFAALVKRLAPDRDPARSPIFDVMFELRASGEIVRGDLAAPGPGARTELAGGVVAEPVPIERRAAQFDLSVTVTDDGHGLGLELEYNADLFDPGTVDALAGHFETMLRAAAADPSARVSRLPLLSEPDRARAIRPAFAAAPADGSALVHRLFEEHASRRPEAAAAHHRGRVLTYGELDRRASSLARRLRALGVGPDVRVAVCEDKSPDLLAALMGVLKAGGAYVPIDPRLPLARRRFLAEDSGARAVVARAGAAEDLGLPVVRLEESAASGPPGTEAPSPHPDNLAYVIYTSGTTGTPKGVAVTHRNLLSAYHAWDRAYDLAAIRSHLQMASPSFDVFTGDLVRALCSGGSLILCDRDAMLDPPVMAALAREHRAEIGDFLPATLRELAAHVARTGERLDSFRIVVIGADTWSMADHDRFRPAFGPDARLLNSYGVTEATIDSACGAVEPADALRPVPPIGRPLANTAAYVLDANLQPLPAGVRGELYLGGPAVARGYVGRPELTAERFLPDPYAGPGARMYRTGDAARRLPDGRIEFIGRADTQVKIRGHRVEPAEVESVLDAHPEVRGCAVVARDEGGVRRLAAYAVVEDGSGTGAEELRAFAAERLPEYMVPSAFVILDALPLTANGKIDRRALPEPAWSSGARGQAAAPVSEEERILAAIWESVLGVPRAGTGDNFFELGGDSILVIQVVARAREAGLRLTPRMIFEHPTIAGCARAAAGVPAAEGIEEAPAEAPLLPIQQWFFEQRFEEARHWNMAVALEARERLDPDLTERAAAALIGHHAALRSRFPIVDTKRVQARETGLPGGVSLLVRELAGSESHDEAVARCARDLNAEVDFEEGPIIRFGLLTGGDGGRCTLVMVAHHLAVDGVSLRVLAEDFDRAYAQLREGAHVALPETTASPGAWASRLAGAVRDGRFDEEIERWASLAIPQAPGLPEAGPLGEPDESTTAAVRIEMDERRTESFLQLAAARGAPPDRALLAAVARAWGAWTGARSLLVEIEGHGRDLLPEVDLSRTVGWLTETHPVLVEGIDPLDLTATLAAVERSGAGRRGGGYGALRCFSPDPAVREKLARIPAPAVSFNYLGRFDATIRASKLFARMSEPASGQRSPKARRTHGLEIDAGVLGGRLFLRCAYSTARITGAAAARLEELLREALDAFTPPALAAAPEVEEILPVTPMQEGMIFHHLREAEDPYVAQIALELTGSVDPAALARAWQHAVDAHPALRTAFVWKDVDAPIRVVHREVRLPVRWHDGAGVDPDALMRGARAEGFDVARAPLARLDIIRHGPERLTAIFTHHHLLLDGWSLPYVLETVFEACEALAAGGRPPEPRRRSGRAYAEWLAGRDAEAAERYFRRRLSGFTSPTPAPGAIAGHAGRRGTSGVLHARGPEGAERRARELGLTPNTAVQAAWALVLSACSGERDVIFGATSSGRPAEVPGMESEVGLFINTLPVRATVDPREKAVEWAARLQREGAELRNHEHAPLAAVQRWAATAPNTPLFETLLVFENYPIDVVSLRRREGFDVTDVRLHEETNYPLTIVVSSEDGLRFRAIYDGARYDEAGVRRVLERLCLAVEGLLSRPGAALGEIETLTEEERRLVTSTWNDTRRPYPRDATVPGIFERIAAEHGPREAILSGDGSLTYDELRHRSLLVARALHARGVRLESRVAIDLERSPDLLVAILGVLEAGAAYVPLDPDSPSSRLERMLADARVSLVVTDGRRALPEGPYRSVSVEELYREGEGAAERALDRPLPESLAYVMFTSGSTGEPKGTEVTHRSILRLVLGTDYAELGPEQTLLLISSVAFDVSTLEIWGALLHGGRLGIVPQGAVSPAEIAGFLERFGVTMVWLTAGLFQIVADEELHALARVPQVLAGGDVVSPNLVRRLLDAGCRRFVDGYGPTETTTFATCEILRPGDVVGERVSIGRPIANTTVYLLDEAMRLVPVGAPGELYVGGDGVSRGYASRPDLTAERFVPDPFGVPGERLYRTGDIARWLPDGRLDYLGRRDGQLKVRGFRVEVGEVELVLASLPGVRSAAVKVWRVRGEAELAGYVVPETKSVTTAASIRSALAERIPKYMIPSRFVFLDALPLNRSGKVDRRALPEPERETGGRGAPPSTPTEEAVAAIYRLLLGVEEVSADDDFFEIGGHSLHATRVVARLRRTLGVELPLRAIFDAPTVRGLARAVEAARGAEAPPLGRASEPERRRASYAQSRLWFLDRLEPGSSAYNIANSILLKGDLDVASLERSLSEVVRRHEALRTRFEEGAEGPLQIVEPPCPVPVPLEDLSALGERERSREAAGRVGEMARAPFDLARGPILRALLLKLGPRDHVLALAMHHIAADGWSVGILVEEIATAYAAFTRGLPPSLPRLPVQYADWAAWQRAWLESGEMDRQLEHWRAELAGLEPLALPSDRPRPARPTYAGATIPVRIGAELYSKLSKLALDEGATPHMALMAAFAAVLGRWSGQESFGIGTPVANRTREEAEPLIGCFVNTLVIRARLEGARLTYRELLRRVRESSLAAYANQDVPFERVVEEIQPERDLSRTPLFQAMLILQNAPSGRLDLGDIEIRPFAAPHGTSTFDVTVSLEPSAGGPVEEEAGAEPGGLRGAIEFSTELFEEATIRRLWSHLERFLEQVAGAPDTEIRRAALLAPAERSIAVEAWSGADRIVTPAIGVHERFARRAEEEPGRIAAIAGERKVSYGEIRDRSARLAALLRRRGVRAEVRVGLCVERGPELLTGMMGILEAGGAFVPLDPDHPRDRIAYALADSEAHVVLATRSTAELVEPNRNLVILLDDEAAYAGEPAPARPASSLSRLAYVIYTSGTTGRPKGVMVTHASLAAAYEAWESLYGLEEIRSHLQMAGAAFDVCTGDVVRALCSGGTLVFCPREVLLDPAALCGLARRERVEFAEFVPAVLRQVASHARRGGVRLETLKIAAIGSDVWTTAELATFKAAFGESTRLANSYGVTEATIDSTCWFADEGGGASGSPPLGGPLTHTTVYVLDEALQPAPPGVTGELYLGGPAVARGYSGKPAQTAERFVPDPFGDPGSRLYRTGDRARYLPDGRVVFAGRADDQIKIRGQRIEPAEVEAAISAMEVVAGCAVTARKSGDGAQRLVAYVVPRGSASLDPDRLRRELRAILPEAMVPSAIVPLDLLPLTPNGKVDRKRLPEPEWESLRSYEPPATPAEKAVAAAFEAVLGVPRVGAGDDFFALGGHSLLATRIVSRLRAELGVELPLRELFEAPVVRALASRVETLGAAHAPPPVSPAEEEDKRRLSYAQQRLWFLDRLEPGTANYNLPSWIHLEGPLNVPALERALAEVVRRHEALRTRFPEAASGPVQEIAAHAPVPLQIADLSGLPERERRAEAERLSREEARRPFDLATGPLLRAMLLRMAPEAHTLLVTIHHICADGWSLVVLVREMGALYGAYARGEEGPLPPLPVQYGDWSAWQRAWLEGGEMERQLAYWREELAGSETLALPSDRPRPARPSYGGSSFEVRMDRALVEKLEALARAEGATLHMALLAGFASTLGRWSGQSDFAVGTPVANRRTAEAEPLIGFFVNTLAMRVRLSGAGLTFRDLLGRIRATALGAHANQDVPFERVVEEVHPERYLGHNPLFQVLFALQNVPVGEIDMPGLKLVYDEPDTGICRFDLEFFLAETGRGLEGLINYSTDLFDRETVERFVENLIALLREGVESPDRPLAEISAMAPRQLSLVLGEWNARRQIYPDPALVHALFEERAALHPEAVAARLGAERITYGELDARAGRLAGFLAKRGIGAEDLVAICVERSFEMLVALLGVMKAGAAYVPVDPEYPADRISLILEDSGARVILTQSALAGRLPAHSALPIRLDEDWAAIEREEAITPAAASPDGLVYAVYTSGSTGRPKGVAMTHRAISNLLSFQRRDSVRGGDGAAPRTLQFASLSFDVSFQEIFSTLTAGGEVVLVSEEERRDAARLLRVVEEQEVERLFVPFVALNQLAETALAEGLHPSCLREIDTAGEQLKITPAISGFFSRMPRCRLVNHYGPSETHLVSTFELMEEPAAWPELPSIGRPIPNAPVYLLDARGRLAPIGAAGEVYVGGAGLARGYHGRPALTAERFVPDPFSPVPGARMYRTGDVARLRSDGNLEFLGRSDLQVKIRGYRVEPGEVESALARHPAVRQAAVRAHEHRGGRRLAAYVVIHDGSRIVPGDLRSHLAATLPEYMVPAAIVALDALPVTPNGKVDRAALPEPDWSAAGGRAAPRGAEEEIVCGIVAEVLDLESVGPTDDFFDLGGHSLLATQVISRVRRAFGTEVPLRAIFETPTPEGIAAAALAARGEGAPAPPPIGIAPPAERRRLSYAQRRLWFLDRLDSGSAVYNLPAALRLEGDLDVRALGRALDEILRRHEALRTRFAEGPEGPEQIVDPPAGLLLEPEEIPGPAGEPREAEARRRLAGEAVRPFDLARGPLLRARLLRLGPREHVLSLVVHHIAADGWSVGVLLRELGALYAAYLRGEESPLGELPVQYADWAAWQRSWLEAGELDRQLAYWRDALAEAPPALDLPTDRARPEEATWRGSVLPVSLASELRGRLARLARSEGATLHMILLAGYAWTLMRHAGQEEIVVGAPVANRRAAEAESLVGFFVNTLPVRVDGGGAGLTFRELVARVRESSLGAYANQDVPFERVVEEIQPERSLNRAPIFQTAFALQNARMPQAELPGLRMTPVDMDTDTAKFDLLLTLEEAESGTLSGGIEYNTQLFDAETIQSIVSSFASHLEWAAAFPDAALAEAPLDPERASARILTEWSAPEAGGGEAGVLLHELVEDQVARTPGAPALAFGEETITYAELEAGSNRLARRLIDLGAGPERRVAILLDRSPAAIAAILAVLKSGAAYVPIEAGDPDERARWIVEDSGACIAVTDARHAPRLEGTGARTVRIDAESSSLAALDATRPAAAVSPSNLAYVIYTSGSTGRPKGVGVEHRQISAYAAAAARRLGIRPGWRFALVSTLAADLGNTSLFPALATGGCLHVIPADLVFDAPALESYFGGHAIDAMKIVPSHLLALLSGSHPERILPRHLLVLGGEATSGATLERLHQLRPECRVANHYGPTEATVGAVAGFPDPTDMARGFVPLGVPLSGLRAYVLDARGRPAPAGIPGELFLGGSGVARGYLGRPDATAGGFLPDPFSGDAGARMYATGDRARWLRDGRLEFLGRRDGQIKVRGFRVEPGEIEALIASQPGVSRAAVVVRKRKDGEARLVAYVAPATRRSPTIHGLKRRRLPSGIAAAELNRNETDYIHREIFDLGAYVRHGITLRDGDTIFDVGANIGLFSVFASLACRSPRILAFEPNPHLQPILRANASAYAADAEVLGVGLAEAERAAPFTFFPGFSLLSGLYADPEVEKEVVKSFIESQARAGVEGAEALADEAEALLRDRFEGRTIDVPLRTLSDVAAERGIDRIHLLKINVEKAELDVLRGIRGEDWPRIDQAVIEVDVAANLQPILDLLRSHDFDLLVDQDPLLERTDLHYVYAIRRGSGRSLRPGAGPSVRPAVAEEPFLAVEELRARVAASLPAPMQPSAWVILESLPLTPNGKLDRRRLPEPASAEAGYVAPRGEIESQVAAIWAEALRVEKVGAHDNFFDLGGHSLLLTRVHARLRESLGAEISVVELFQFPTVAALAARLAGSKPEAREEEAHRERGAGRRDAMRARARRARGAPEKGA